MSARVRPTSADVLRIIGNDPVMASAARAAAVRADTEWEGGDPPNGWIGGQVRGILPAWLDDVLGTWEDDDAHGDPTGEIGAAFYPFPCGRTVTDRAGLDRLPDGALLVDRDGYVFEKQRFTTTASDGTVRHGHEYVTIYNPDDERVTTDETPGAAFSADEIAEEPEPGMGSTFLPGRAYVIGGRR